MLSGEAIIFFFFFSFAIAKESEFFLKDLLFYERHWSMFHYTIIYVRNIQATFMFH